MLQCGLLVPADQYSRVGVFNKIFTDIGDDQSIESDLSTYSAHLLKMKYFAGHSDERTLVLIDELGTGTDPQFGGPIGGSVLLALNERKVRGVVTTHYSHIKLLAGSTEGMQNAAMMFDSSKMQPLYILETGKPGSSYALEIAERTGLPDHIIRKAKESIGEQQGNIDKMLVDLEREKASITVMRDEMEKKRQRLQQLQEENEQQKRFLDENKKKWLREAKEQAADILSRANRLIENTIAEIRRSHADKETVKTLREHLSHEKARIQELEEKTTKPMDVSFSSGDWVIVSDTGTMGQIIDISRENAVIAIGDLRSVVKVSRLEKTESHKVKKEMKRSVGNLFNDGMKQFSPEIDVRGMRGDTAVSEIEKYIDRAIMLGVGSVRIIHGKGEGILRKLIRGQLMKYAEVDRMEDEHADLGGEGVTYVYFK
jgi:DNA mismatch repair protein MutS2